MLSITLSNSGFIRGVEKPNGHYYDCSSHKQADTSVTTTKTITEYIGKTYTNEGRVEHTLGHGEMYDIPNPQDSPANYTDETEDDNSVNRTTMEQVAYVDKKALIVIS